MPAPINYGPTPTAGPRPTSRPGQTRVRPQKMLQYAAQRPEQESPQPAQPVAAPDVNLAAQEYRWGGPASDRDFDAHIQQIRDKKKMENVAKWNAAAQATAPQGGGSYGGEGTFYHLIPEAAKIAGVGEDWIPFLNSRMKQESGGRNIAQGIVDVNTRKGTPAFGPMQVIQPTFNANALGGYNDWRNPLHNIIASIRYIQGRYGHPSRLPRGGY